jgi:RNA polymerase subunit RPABC4/transcription elongation factor Spt4
MVSEARMQQPVTRQQMESFARALQAAKTDSTATPHEIEQATALHAHFRARDAAGTVWTVAVRSLQWHHLGQGQWVEAEPSQPLFLDDRVLVALQALTARPATAAPPAVVPGALSQAASCRQCGAPLQAHQKFCTKCGTTVVPASVPATPPVAPTATTSPAIAPPKVAVPTIAPALGQCPRCGRAMSTGQKFCTGCGQRL